MSEGSTINISELMDKLRGQNEDLNRIFDFTDAIVRENEIYKTRIKELEEKLSLYENMRPEVLAFSEEMERILKANDHKGGWKRSDVTVTYLKRRLTQEISEFERALAAQREIYPGNARSKAAVLSEACDVANFLMMICDVVDALPTPPSTQEALKNLTQIGEEMGLYDLPPSTQEGEE